jgi:hypothetical protein
MADFAVGATACESAVGPAGSRAVLCSQPPDRNRRCHRRRPGRGLRARTHGCARHLDWQRDRPAAIECRSKRRRHLERPCRLAERSPCTRRPSAAGANIPTDARHRHRLQPRGRLRKQDHPDAHPRRKYRQHRQRCRLHPRTNAGDRAPADFRAKPPSILMASDQDDRPTWDVQSLAARCFWKRHICASTVRTVSSLGMACGFEPRHRLDYWPQLGGGRCKL